MHYHRTYMLIILKYAGTPYLLHPQNIRPQNEPTPLSLGLLAV